MSNQQFYYKLIKMIMMEGDNFLENIMNDFIRMNDIPQEFVEQNKDYIDWELVISEWPETKYIAKIGARFIPSNIWKDAIDFDNVSDEFIREFEKYIDWEVAADNFCSLSNDIKNEFKDRLIPHLFKCTPKPLQQSNSIFPFNHPPTTFTSLFPPITSSTFEPNIPYQYSNLPTFDEWVHSFEEYVEN